MLQREEHLDGLNETEYNQIKVCAEGSGIRLRKTVNGVTTQYYLNGSLILSEVTGNVQTDYYYDESGNVFGFKRGNSEYYYIRNGQGDIIGILDSSGTQVVSYVYDSWGKLVSISGSQADTIGETNPFRYRGYYYDTETGFYYVSSRYYDPEVGRWINADAVVPDVGDSMQGYNLFSYCFNNPVNMSDDSGHWPKWLENAANWVNEKIVQPAKEFVFDVVEDIKNFDINNQSEKKALESNYFSAYKGVPVVRIGGNRSGSFGAIFLTRETNNRADPEDVVRHEYGHTQQLQELGIVKYAIDIGIPSALEIGGGDYYSRPWEITADIYGRVQSRNHTNEDIEAGFSYLERSKSSGPFVWIFMY